jgi:hypothetical protein
MEMPWTSLIESITGLAGEYIEDKDKSNEIKFKIQELEFKLRESLLVTKTTPKVDAFVKVLIAFRDIILPMLRPVGAAMMTGFGMYCHYKGIPLDGATQVVMDGAFPAWGASRHVNKKHEETEKTKRHKKEGQDPFWFDED